jgi:hypothetical protein
MERRDITYIKELLDRNFVRVTFTKANGEERVMDCTRKEDVVPEPPREDGPDCITVWDIYKKEWRRFKPSRVIKYEV